LRFVTAEAGRVRGTFGAVTTFYMTMTPWLRPALVLTAVALLGCPSDAQPPRPQAATTQPEGPRFDVDVEAPARATKGKKSEALVKLRARSPWHMNLEYAPRLRVDAVNGVDVAATTSAAHVDAEGAEFALPFTATNKGPTRIAGQLQFAVCVDEACAPESVPVDFTVDVGCDTDAFC
jgi:hypothetical protein